MTTPEQRRAVRAVKQRMHDSGCSEKQLSEHAGIDPKTLRGFLTGKTWPRAKTLHRLCVALGWPPGHIHRIARGSVMATPAPPAGSALDAYTSEELLIELLRRNAEWHVSLTTKREVRGELDTNLRELRGTR